MYLQAAPRATLSAEMEHNPQTQHASHVAFASCFTSVAKVAHAAATGSNFEILLQSYMTATAPALPPRV